VIFIEVYLLNHPLLFVSKVIVAIVSIGFYIAVGIALEVEYGHIKNIKIANRKTLLKSFPPHANGVTFS